MEWFYFIHDAALVMCLVLCCLLAGVVSYYSIWKGRD